MQRFSIFSISVKIAFLNWFGFSTVIFQPSKVNNFVSLFLWGIEHFGRSSPYLIILSIFCSLGWTPITAISSVFMPGVMFEFVFLLSKPLCQGQMPCHCFLSEQPWTCLLHGCQCKELPVPCPEDFTVMIKDMLCKQNCWWGCLNGSRWSKWVKPRSGAKADLRYPCSNLDKLYHTASSSVWVYVAIQMRCVAVHSSHKLSVGCAVAFFLGLHTGFPS